MIVENLFDMPMESKSIQQILSRLQRKSAVLSNNNNDDDENSVSFVVEVGLGGRGEEKNGSSRMIRNPVMRCHSFRKMFNTICIKNNMNHYVKEKLMGHKKQLELDFNYFRPNESQLLNEYLKVINDLTINDENRLSKQVQEFKEKDEYQKYIIDKKLKEKDMELEKMQQTMKTVFEQVETFNKSLKDQTVKEVESKKAVISTIEGIKTDIKKMLEIDKKKEELLAKKGFITKEDMELIDDSYRDQILGKNN